MTGRWTYRVSAVGVLVLAAAAFTLSYDALHQLALDTRVRPALAWLWPVVIDGTIVVALLTVLAAKRAAARVAYPWTLAGLFSLASVAFNIAHAPDRPVAQLVFAMAPVALVLTTHLLMQQAGWRHPRSSPDPKAATDIPVAVDTDMLAHQSGMAVAVASHTQPPPQPSHYRSGPASYHDSGMAGRGPDMPGPTVRSRDGQARTHDQPAGSSTTDLREPPGHRQTGVRVRTCASAWYLRAPWPAAARRSTDRGRRLRQSQRRRPSAAQAGRSHVNVTNEEREGVREAARRYVHEQAPTPPDAILERVAGIVLQARSSRRMVPVQGESSGNAALRHEAWWGVPPTVR